MKKLITLLIVGAALCIVFALSGCENNNTPGTTIENPIVGDWEISKDYFSDNFNGFNYVFYQDKTALYVDLYNYFEYTISDTTIDVLFTGENTGPLSPGIWYWDMSTDNDLKFVNYNDNNEWLEMVKIGEL